MNEKLITGVMDVTLYVRLLNEGTQAYRPVSASLVRRNVYLIGVDNSYDAENEEWEFLPGTHVVAEHRILEGNDALVVVSKFN